MQCYFPTEQEEEQEMDGEGSDINTRYGYGPLMHGICGNFCDYDGASGFDLATVCCMKILRSIQPFKCSDIRIHICICAVQPPILEAQHLECELLIPLRVFPIFPFSTPSRAQIADEWPARWSSYFYRTLGRLLDSPKKWA